jgi:putative DNA primase/helicase
MNYCLKHPVNGYNFDNVGRAAKGRWTEILSGLGVNQSFLNTKKPMSHGPCPGCGGVDRFRFDDKDGRGTFICGQGGGDPMAGDGFDLLCHVFGWDKGEALQRVAKYLGIDSASTTYIPYEKSTVASRKNDKQNHTKTAATHRVADNLDNHKREALRRIWVATISATNHDAKPLHQYLRNRGLGGAVGRLSNGVRFHPCLEYWHEGQFLGNYPAMVCLVSDPQGKPVSIHRTYLTEDGHKASVPCPKKLASPIVPGATRGAAIRLSTVTDSLAVAEGIETALAVYIATSMPAWATVSAGGMAALKLPESIRKVYIMADLDRSGAGELAARELAMRLTMQGRDARLVLPQGPIPDDAKSVDWLDVLQGVGHEC